MAENETTKNKPDSEPASVLFHPDLVEVDEAGSLRYLKGYQCDSCGQLDFPKVTPCPNCWGETFTMLPLSSKGTLYSFTEVHFGQAGMRTPYMFGYVDLPEGVRIFAQLTGSASDYKCDQQVEVSLAPIRVDPQGKEVVSYVFKKVP